MLEDGSNHLGQEWEVHPNGVASICILKNENNELVLVTVPEEDFGNASNKAEAIVGLKTKRFTSITPDMIAFPSGVNLPNESGLNSIKREMLEELNIFLIEKKIILVKSGAFNVSQINFGSSVSDNRYGLTNYEVDVFSYNLNDEELLKMISFAKTFNRKVVIISLNSNDKKIKNFNIRPSTAELIRQFYPKVLSAD